jgi:RNA polymerase sigma factor (sigma-70 family)
MAIPNPETIAADRAFVDRVINNDPDAIFELLTKRIGPMIQLTLQKLKLGDQSGALFQFLSAKNWKVLQNWKGQCSIDTWLNTICVRFLYRLARKEGLEISKPNVESLIDSEASAGTECPMEKLIKQERWGILIDAIRSLPHERYRLVLSLRYLDGRELVEIAKILNVSLANLAVLNVRAIQALKRFLRDGGSLDV